MKFNFKSEPDQMLEKPGESCEDHGNYMCTEDDCSGEFGLIEINDFFNTGHTDDLVVANLLEIDWDTGILTIQGELSEEDLEEICSSNYTVGGIPDADDVLRRIEIFTEEWSIEWIDKELFDNDGELVE